MISLHTVSIDRLLLQLQTKQWEYKYRQLGGVLAEEIGKIHAYAFCRRSENDDIYCRQIAPGMAAEIGREEALDVGPNSKM